MTIIIIKLLLLLILLSGENKGYYYYFEITKNKFSPVAGSQPLRAANPEVPTLQLFMDPSLTSLKQEGFE